MLWWNAKSPGRQHLEATVDEMLESGEHGCRPQVLAIQEMGPGCGAEPVQVSAYCGYRWLVNDERPWDCTMDIDEE